MVLAGVLAVVVTAAAACTAAGDDGPAESLEPTLLEPVVTHTTPGPASTTTASPTEDEEQIALLISDYWTAYFEANDPPDPGHVTLNEILVGGARDTSLENITKRQRLGQVVRPREGSRFQSEVLRIDLREMDARAEVCVIDDSLLLDRASGMVLNDAVMTYLFDFHLYSVDGRWRISERTLLRQWEGATQCV